MRYTERVIKPLGTEFETFKETTEQELMSFPLEDIDDSHEIWQQANGRMNAFIAESNERLRRSLLPVNVDESAFDFGDIDELFNTVGKGPHLVELDFVADTKGPTAYMGKNDKIKHKWIWRHRLTGYTLLRFENPGGLSYESGRLYKYMRMLKKNDHPLAYARAQHILLLNDAILEPQAAKDGVIVEMITRKDLLYQQVCIVAFVTSFHFHSTFANNVLLSFNLR
jgi:hypothetical protein